MDIAESMSLIHVRLRKTLQNLPVLRRFSLKNRTKTYVYRGNFGVREIGLMCDLQSAGSALFPAILHLARELSSVGI